MKVELDEFKRDVLKRLDDDIFDVIIFDNNENEIKSFSYCNTERILMFIVDFGYIEKENGKLFVDVIMYKEFIRIRTKEDGYISVDLSIRF